VYRSLDLFCLGNRGRHLLVKGKISDEVDGCPQAQTWDPDISPPPRNDQQLLKNSDEHALETVHALQEWALAAQELNVYAPGQAWQDAYLAIIAHQYAGTS
jgi:hypothetical protein